VLTFFFFFETGVIVKGNDYLKTAIVENQN
jgi:hypothetical protein